MKTRRWIACATALALVGCGGADDGLVGGTLSGLAPGLSVTLQDNGTSDLTVSKNGAFRFDDASQDDASYDVTVSVQPLGETCSVADGEGTVYDGDAVNDIAVTCTVTSSITGTVSGLQAGTGLTLSNGSVSLPVTENGTFAFAGALAAGAAYSVSVAGQPVGHTCLVANGSGTVPASQIVSVTVVCS